MDYFVKTFEDEKTQKEFVSDYKKALSDMTDEEFVKRFNNRLNVSDGDIFLALW